ncbi:MAG TPA: bifunctional 4-hydroxy-2-oxoglutarate aldolase/2-dehydro-3-deoxy-phosphogluconate aldolase [Verrucomicrobiae bacterium]|nr:bifunctional 4-hydroxy-2-oxoglutarate aldolase/2-dehydro-3-deoxy-phosphogluconate aldolase [Verrucomicrobiae bacterium]
MNFPASLFEQICRNPIIAVLTLEDPGAAPDLARALLAGGVRGVELTLRTPAALESLKRLKEAAPELILGAGTVLTPAQVKQVKDVGVAFAVSPGLNPRVVRAAQEAGVPFAPGICTPSDIEGALELGCTLLKYFPAETSGGLKHLKNMAAPYMHLGVGFIPLGGLNEANMLDYLGDSLIPAIGGSWIAPRDKIAARDWAAIEGNARRAVEKWKMLPKAKA